MVPDESVLLRAAGRVHARRNEYGKPERHLETVAVFWSVIAGVPITPRQVALMMVGLKVVRAAGALPGRATDSLVDIAGYAELASLADPPVEGEDPVA